MLHNKRERAGAVMGIQIDADGAGMSGEHQNLPAGRGSVDADSLAVPVIIADAREQAARRLLEFFAATIRNKNTRMAYYRLPLFAWVEQHQIGELADIEPIHVAAYIKGLQATAAKPTVKLHLAAIRMLFDGLAVGQVLKTPRAHRGAGPPAAGKRQGRQEDKDCHDIFSAFRNPVTRGSKSSLRA
jgi:hypothetical protein